MNDRPEWTARNDEYECIDPDLGAELWRRDDPATGDEMRRRLATHIAFCAACRLRAGIGDEIAAGLRNGRLRLPGRHARRELSTRVLAGAGATALAAGLALVFLLPPASSDPHRLVRAGVQGGIVRPLPDEQIRTDRPEIRWNPVDGAVSYRVTVRGVESGYAWSEETPASELRVPPDHTLPPDTRFRVTVETVPADLSPHGGWRTSFARVSFGQFVKHRLDVSRPMARWSGIAGILALGAAFVLGITQRRS